MTGVAPHDADVLPARIMVVDDEVLVRLIAVDLLTEAGFRVVEACNADEAIMLLATELPIDLIFTDVTMPGALDGVGLVAYVKQHYPAMPVIMTSGGTAPHELARAGADAVVAKPYSAAGLTTLIARLLGTPGD